MRPAAAAPALAALLAAAWGAAAHGEEPDCPPAPVRVEVAVEDPEPALDRRAGMDALREESGEPGGAAYRHLGATESKVEWRSESEARVAEKSGRFCARPERISIRLRHAEHRIRVARELRRGGCLFRETEAHERRHVAVNRAALRDAAAEVEAAVRGWADSAVGRGGARQEALDELQAGLRRAVAPAIDSLRAARDAGHRAIDGPEEYRRLGEVCPDEQKALRVRRRSR